MNPNAETRSHLEVEIENIDAAISSLHPNITIGHLGLILSRIARLPAPIADGLRAELTRAVITTAGKYAL
jgi:hypothetical protein